MKRKTGVGLGSVLLLREMGRVFGIGPCGWTGVCIGFGFCY